MSKSLVVLVFAILLGSFPVFAQGGKVSPTFQMKSNPLIRVIAAEIILRFPMPQTKPTSELSIIELEQMNRVRHEALLIFKGLPRYAGLLDFTESFMQGYEERLLDDQPASLSEEKVYAWAAAYQQMHGGSGTSIHLIDTHMMPVYNSSVEQIRSLPDGIKRLMMPETNPAEYAWLMDQAHKRASQILAEATENAEKPADCSGLLTHNP